ncbi:MAG: hypothetical protein C5B51_19040 [Terriglobia bacterium]|nr:MAG: hypothetical protein C5B51_19040 [Terriglobia bacterium]
MKAMFELALAATIFLCCCGPVTPRTQESKADPTMEPWYGQAVSELAAMDREAESLLRAGKSDEAAAVVTKGQPLANRVLGVPRPTLAATEAASDLDQLYARMLLANGNYGWARLLFQKDETRWKIWKPQTAETARRRKLAAEGIAECDRQLSQ